jgi:TP901 family phage tail tape measure protein
LKDAKTLRDNLGRPIDIKLNTRSLAQPLGRITGDVAEFTKSLQAATARVTAFGATSGGIIAVSQAISMVAKSVIEVDKQLIELNTFLGQSQSGLKSIGDSLFKVAKNTASSFADTAEAAKEFARQGLSVEETLKRTNDALVLSRISGLGAADSVNALTTAINSFNKSGLDSAEIINKLVKVDSNFAVSAADLAQALTRVGSAAQDSGVGFEELIAVVTAAQQTTGRGGAIIGNALKTIFTRLKRPEVLDQLQALGVAVKDQNGALLSGTQILTNYISATKNLGQVEKARNDELLGGVYQINQLKAITNDLAKANGIYARSLQIANSATDDATKKNDELNKSLSAVIQNTKTNFEKRGGSIGEPIIKPLVKRIAGASNFLLDNLGVDKSSTDKDGKEIGNTFGQSFLKGFGEAVAGPGLVLFGVLALNIGKRLVSFVSDAAKVLLNINSVAGNTQAIEQAINNTLAQQPKITKAILSGQLTREQAASQLLRVFTLQNQQLMLQKGLASSIAQSFSKSGYVASPEIGIYKNTKRKAEGYIPAFAAEKREAMSYGASPNVQPYMTKAVIKGVPQDVVVNTEEKIIPNFAGGRDTAILPNYAKGNVPGLFNINSVSGLQRLIKNNAQKFLSIKYKTENGIIENFDAKKYNAQFGPAVRKDEYKGASPPRGFKTWKEFREATNTISIRTSSGERKTFRADRILQVNAGGNSFVPSASLQKANELTAPFNSKTLRGMGVENLTNLSASLSNSKVDSAFSVLKSAKTPEEAEKAGKAYAKALLKIPRLAKGYMPPKSRPSSRVGKSADPVAASPDGKTAFGDSIGSAVSTALYYFLPSILSGFANEKNQPDITKGLQGVAIAGPLIAAIKGFSSGGVKGGLTKGLGAALPATYLYSQASGLEKNVKSDIFEKARDKALNGFNKLTENIGDLTQTISDLDALYADPNARPDALIKLGKKEQDLLKKISLNNPEAAVAYKSAGTPAEKQAALTAAKDATQKEASISKSVLDFSELDKAKRDAKAVTSFFADLAGQLDNEKVDVSSLNGGNFNDFLKKGGIGKTAGVFSNTESGKVLTDSFIKFLKNQEKIVNLNKTTETDLAEIKKPLIALQGKVEAAQGLRAASKEARGGYLENVSRFAGNFGERAGIEGKSIVDKYNLSRPEKETFANRLSVESRNLTKGSFAQAAIRNLSGEVPSAALGTKIQSIINASPNASAKDLEILKRILTQNITSTRKLENIEKIANVQKDYALKNLSLQEKLSFGGGIKTSIDASSKIDSIKNTQRGALQYQLGSTFGSKETQIAGLANFATNLKDKYAGLFEGEGGKQAFGGIADLLTELRASDIKQSLSRDASTARSMGQFGLAGQLESKLDPRNQGQIYDMARLQSEQQLGITPTGLLNQTTNELSGADAKERSAKMAEDASLKSLEDQLKPAINLITTSFVDEINKIQGPLKDSLETAFGKGVEIANATLIATNLDLSSIFASKNTPETLAGGFIPNFSQSAISDAIDREKTSLTQRGIPASVTGAKVPNFAKINIEQSNKLMNRSNPMGFAVTNSVDEPNGLASIGLASGGFVPNFAKGPDDLISKYATSVANFLFGEFIDVKPGQSPYDIYDPKKIVGGEFEKVFEAYSLGSPKSKRELEALKMADPNLDNFKKAVDAELASAGKGAPRLLLPAKIEADIPKPIVATSVVKAVKAELIKPSSTQLTPEAKKPSPKKAAQAEKTIKEVIAKAINKPAEKAKKPTKSISASPAQSIADFGLSIYDPGASNFERLGAVKAKASAERLAKEQSIESIKQRSTLRRDREGGALKSYLDFWMQNTQDYSYENIYNKVIAKKFVNPEIGLESGQSLLPLEMLGRTKEGRFQKSVETFVNESLIKQKQAAEDRKEIEALKKGKRSKSGKGQLPLFEQERSGGSVFGKGLGTYAPAKGLNYLSLADKELRVFEAKQKRNFKRHKRSYNEVNNPLSAKIKDIILNKSGFRGKDIESIFGMSSKNLQAQNAYNLESLMTDKGIIINQKADGSLEIDLKNAKAFQDPDSAKKLRSSLEYTFSKSGNRNTGKIAVEPFASFDLPAGGNIGLPEGFTTKKFGKSGFFSDLSSYVKGFPKGALDFLKAENAGSLTGIVSKQQINLKAGQLIRLEKELNKYNIPDGVKEAIVSEFLNKQGPFAEKIKARSDERVAKINERAVSSDIRGKLLASKSPAKSSDFFLEVQKEIATAIGEGKLSEKRYYDKTTKSYKTETIAQQAARLQELAFSDRGFGYNEYADVLAKASKNQGKSLTGDGIKEFYQNIVEGSGLESSLKEKITEAFDIDRLKIANKKISRLGYKTNKEGQTFIGEGGKSFGVYELEQIKEINKSSGDAKTKEAQIKILKESIRAAETKAKSSAAAEFGFEYNPATREVLPKGTAKEMKAAQAVAAAAEGNGGLGSKFSKGKAFAGKALGVAGVGMGAVGAYEAFKEGNIAEGSFSAIGALASVPTGMLSKSPTIKSLVEKIGQEGLGKIAGGAFGAAGAIGSGIQAKKEFDEGKTGEGAYSALQAAVSGGAGVSAVVGQQLLSKNLFGVGAALGFGRELYNSKDNNFQLTSGSTTKGRFLSALTGQNFEGEVGAEQVLAAIGDVAGTFFTAGMGPVGAATTTARLGYRLGNFLEQSIDDLTGYSARADKINSKYGTEKIANAEAFGIEKERDMFGYARGEGELSPEEKRYKNYLENLKKQYSNEAGGFIPNYAISKEMSAIKNSPDYAGYRNAMPKMSSVYGDKVINSAEIEVPAKEVYARMFGPAGYGMSPKNPSETHAVLNPAQQSALGYAGGFVPNFSNEQFASMMSEAMKNGMASFMADGFMPAASNSNVVNINDNRNVQSSMESNPGVLDAVMDVLLKMHPKEMAAIGPKITKVR